MAPDTRAPRPPGVPGWLTHAIPPRVARWFALPSALLVTVLVHYPALRIYQPDGSARHLGHGSRAEAALGDFTMRTEQWALAERMFLRSLALGDTLPDAVFGLGITRVMQGREDEARVFAEEGLRRWPHDPRALAILEGLRRDRTAR